MAKTAKAQETSEPPPRLEGAGIFYRHDTNAEEVQAKNYPDRGYNNLFHWCQCQVDTTRGGYVEERDAEGNVKQAHRALPHQLRTAGGGP